MSRRIILALAAACAAGGLTACGTVSGGRPMATQAAVVDPAPIVSGTMRPYQIRGRWYRPMEQPDYDEQGLASWYGDAHHGRPTATGERFDMNALTAAHKTLPLPSLVEVTNPDNGRRIVVRVNDRGPFVDGRIIDLSRGAAEALGLRSAGVAEVRVRYVGRAPRLGGGRVQQAEARPQTPQGPGDIWVQAAALSDGQAARDLARRLGDRAEVRPVERDGRTLYRVLVGPWRDANAAERSRQSVIARGFPDALLISGG